MIEADFKYVIRHVYQDCNRRAVLNKAISSHANMLTPFLECAVAGSVADGAHAELPASKNEHSTREILVKAGCP
eukprot:2705011-Amphidinium_carterae.1